MENDAQKEKRPDDEKNQFHVEKARSTAKAAFRHSCEFCGRFFTSRNLVFKHLNDAAGGSCGTHIALSHQTLPQAPSVVRKEQRKAAVLEAAKTRRRNKTGQTTQHTQHCLWIGDLPLPWTRHGGNYRRFRALLRAHLPRTVQQPWIKFVLRKAYRTTLIESENGVTTTTTGRVYVGYAIVVFRDDQECGTVLQALEGREITVHSVFSKNDLEISQDFAKLAESGVSPFVMKVRPAENETKQQQSETTDTSLPPGRDPPLSDQLRPLSTEELQARIKRLCGVRASAETTLPSNDTNPISMHDQHDEALKQAVVAIESVGRTEIRHEGRLIPVELRDRLLLLLQNLRWSVPNQRAGLSAERYLVLLTSVTNDLFYQDLRDACRAVMDWADPCYYYSGIAVTKNFVSSPHIDDRDQTFQYAISLGDFCAGGELCVDGLDGDNRGVIHVVSTHNRIARTDGRHVHWVRTWEGGDRYSLIFYDTSDRHPTPVIPTGVDDVMPNEQEDEEECA